MKKKNILVAAALAALVVIGTTSTLIIQKNGGLGVFATMTLNEYGCVSNCTGEYYPSSIISKAKSNTEVVGTKNVRIIAKACNVKGDDGRTYFQDIDTETVTAINKTSVANKVIRIQGTRTGLTGWKAEDTVCFYGEIDVVSQEIKIGNEFSTTYATASFVVIKNPVIYQINDTQNLSLLTDVVYLQ